MDIYRLDDLEPTRWKNGAGITRVIAERDDARGSLWRLSLADMDRDADFSAFPGLTRILTVVQGAGIVLHPSGAGPLPAGFAEPVRFSGATPLRATLRHGPVRNFNLMFNADFCTADARVATAPGQTCPDSPGDICVVHGIEGQVTLTGAGGTDLPPGTTAIGPPMGLELAPGSMALILTLRENAAG